MGNSFMYNNSLFSDITDVFITVPLLFSKHCIFSVYFSINSVFFTLLFSYAHITFYICCMYIEVWDREKEKDSS